MSKSLNELTNDLLPLVYNPTALRNTTLDLLKSNLDGTGKEIVDPSNPFVFLHDNMIAMTSAAIEHNETSCRRRYLYLATTMDELYPHMSDNDHLDRFSQPSNSKWVLLIGKDELIEKAVPRDIMGVRKLIIPRDTYFTVNGITFTIQYPIEIRYLPHGGIQVVYNTDEDSPIKMLGSNTLDWRIIQHRFNNKLIDIISIDIPTLQYEINSFTDTVISGTNFNKQYTFKDSFYTARVWIKNASGRWVEINTTYTEMVIDVDTPTAKLKVDNGMLYVNIPDIYIRSKLVSGDIRVDIYQTRGKIELDLRQFSPDMFSMTLTDIGQEIDSYYYNPLKSFRFIQTLSSDMVTGGRSALNFKQLKHSLIENALNGAKIPISEKQLNNEVGKYGFDLHKSIDFVTDRIYYAAADMPSSTIPEVSTPIGILNSIVTTSINVLSQMDSVRDNGKRLTITPDTIYKEEYGLVELLSKQSISGINKLANKQIVDMLNKNTLLFTPIHYVLDNYTDTLEIRPYYLDKPKITARRFIATNETLLLDVSTDSYEFHKTDTGYKLRITTRSGDNYKQLSNDKLIAQLSFTPRGYSNLYMFKDGKVVGLTENQERIWEWDIDTNLDIDRNHDIIINNFSQSFGSVTDTPLPLVSMINIIYGVKNYTTPHYKAIESDYVLVHRDKTAKVIMHEQLKFDLGKALDGLWSSVRPVSGTIEYDKYAEDVYATYEDDVIKYVDGAPVYSIHDGRVVFEYLHHKGDKKLDEHGQPKLLFSKGSNKIVNGKPVILNSRDIKWRLELFLFDAKYIFGNTPDIEKYLDNVIRSIIKYSTDNIHDIKVKLLEKTKIFIYPKTSIGNVNVLNSDSTTSIIKSDCKFTLSYYLTEASRRNNDLLKTLDRVSKEVIIDNLNKRTVTVSSILDDIRSRVGTDIIDVEMGFIGDTDEKLLTVLDSTQRLTLAKKAIVNADGTVGIKDDIAIGYFKYFK